MSIRAVRAAPSAAAIARSAASKILAELDQVGKRHGIAARLAEILLFRELGTRLGPVLLELTAGIGEDEPLPPRRRAEP